MYEFVNMDVTNKQSQTYIQVKSTGYFRSHSHLDSFFSVYHSHFRRSQEIHHRKAKERERTGQS